MSKHPVSYNIPLPARKARSSKYPVDEIEVGGSFPITTTSLTAARSSFAAFGKRHKMKFRVGPDPKKPGGLRVWRTA